MDLASKYLQCNPWPGREQSQVLFILDSRNRFEQDILRGWIQHHAQGGDNTFTAQQICLDLGDDRRGIDTTPLVAALSVATAPRSALKRPSPRKLPVATISFCWEKAAEAT